MVTDDLKFAIRGVRRDPLYAAAVVATLALTLGASTAVFSIVNGVLLRPLPYADPAQLVSVREVLPKLASQYPSLPANARHFDEWRNRATSFASIAALDWRTMNVAGAGDSMQATVVRVSGTLFDVLQLPVAIGRPLTRDDERTDRPRVAAISDELWREQYSRDPTTVGRTLLVGGVDYTIVGVLPPRLDLPGFDVLGDAATLNSRFAAMIPLRVNLATIGWAGTYNYPVVARVKHGVTIEQARAELNVLQTAIAAIAQRETHEAVDLRGRILPLADAVVGSSRLGLLLLLGATVGVVLIACANLANLSLTRALGRLRDAAVRAALGASRGQLVRAQIVEQLVLAAAGGALGLVVAREALEVFVTTAPVNLPRVHDVVIDRRVLGFAASLAMAAGLAVALLPAWRLGRRDLESMLRGGGHGSTDRGGARVRGVLLSVQVALSVALVVVTGLFVASFTRLLRIDPGFSTEHVVSLEIAPGSVRYPDTPARAALYDRIAERARQLPGVTAVSWTSALPLTGETWVDAIAQVNDARPAAERPTANYRFVGPEYFRALSMPILKGRAIDERDRTKALTPAVISARAAQTLWSGADPIGKEFARGDPSQHFEVVGVVVDGHPTALDTDSPLMVYVPYWFNNEGKSLLVARANGDAAALVRDLRTIVRGIDRQVAIGEARPLRDVVDQALDGRRYQMSLFIAFGVVALLIATIGVYATTAYGVSRRRREMNIRVALGAPIADVFALVLRQAAVPLGIGVVAGGAGAAAIGTLIAGLLFQVRPRDPLVMTMAALLVAAAGLAAAAGAARNGLRINPVEALREE
jgi:putative ABC transport system permease protein